MVISTWPGRFDLAGHPSAERVEQNVPLYDSDRLRSLATSPDGRRGEQSELAGALLDGPGIVVNVVNPGGAAQSVHRDYHLGFLSQDRAAASRRC